MRRLLPLLLLAAAAPAKPHDVLVLVQTSLGPITLDIDVGHAPITGANFLHYVDAHNFDGRTFYRAARAKYDKGKGFIQGGVNHQAKFSFFPIPHEPTTITGLHHTDGALSMARNAPGTAAGDWVICVGNQTFMDARAGFPGYAVFGHVVSGMPVVKKILAAPTYPGGYDEATLGQVIRNPVQIISARRLPPR